MEFKQVILRYLMPGGLKIISECRMINKKSEKCKPPDLYNILCLEIDDDTLRFSSGVALHWHFGRKEKGRFLFPVEGGPLKPTLHWKRKGM